VTAAHGDPVHEENLCHLFQRRALAWGSPDPIAVALRTGEPRILSSGGSRGAAGDEDLVEHVWAAGARTAMIVPVIARGRMLGVTSYFSRGDDREYGPVDLDLAEDLGRRVAVALDNARLYREAREATRARDAFLQSAAHELRTPLTRLSLQLGLAQQEVRALVDGTGLARVKPRFDVAARQVETLTRLVDHMLEVTRAEADEVSLALTEVDLSALAEQVLARLRPEVERSGCAVTFASSGPVTGRWDRARLDDIVVSLVSNAVKYGARKPITVRVDGDDVFGRLSIEDRGIGIAAEDQGRIFERFERAVSVRHYSGFGLGLWIAWEAATALGGNLRVESAPGAGAIFTLEVPRAGPSACG
jgi:signal transduction histidine kinase